nr:uncharacterized protein LOC105344790 [Crassostrea gigas]
MDKIKKEVEMKMKMDQKDPDVHRYIVDNGVVKIKLHLEQLKKETSGLKLDEKKDWKKREKILRETIESVKVLHVILSNTTDDALVRFRQCDEVFPLVFEIGKTTCAIMCMISRHLSKRFSSDNKKLCCGLLEIPVIFDNVLAYLTPEQSTDLSDGATIEGILKDAIILCRANLHQSSINFNIFVSTKVRKVLQIMEFSKFRTQEGFKPFLSSVVKQFLFVQRACGLTREILKCTPDKDWSSNSFEYKKMFKRVKRLLGFGIRAIRSLGFKDQSSLEFNSIDIVCKQIKQCNENLTADINLER